MDESVAPPPDAIADHSGWFFRRRIFGIMQKRFAKLIGTNLLIYKDDSCTSLELGLKITTSTTVETFQDGKCFRFILGAPTTNVTYPFEVEDSEQLLRWVIAIRGCTYNHSIFTMDSFKIISVIGRGYFGKVMLVKRIDNNELYAIKSIHKNRLIQANKIQTVISERNILARVNHPFIVSLKFAFQTASKFYIGMEYVPGGELFFHIQKRGKMQLDETRLYIAEIALALDHLHSNQILYRDLKPENIMLDAEGFVKLTDFGLAKDCSQAGQASTLCGTNEYIPPEMIKKESYSYPVDWWMLGIITYELLFGNTPFSSINLKILFQKILFEEPRFPEYCQPEVKDFILILLNKDPKRRGGFQAIKNSALMKGLDFNEVLNRKIKPVFVPEIKSPTRPDNFDTTFTQEAPADSYVNPVQGPLTKFEGFSFVGEGEEINVEEKSDESIHSSGPFQDILDLDINEHGEVEPFLDPALSIQY